MNCGISTFVMKTRIFFPIFASVIVSTMSLVQKSMYFQHFSEFDNNTCVSSVFSAPANSRIHCAMLCTNSISHCESLFYTPDQKQCVGCPHFYAIYMEDGMLQPQTNTEHYGIGNFKTYATSANVSTKLPVYDQHDLYADGARIAADKHIVVYFKGKSDAHVLLQADRSVYGGIEVAIAGWSNHKSAFRNRTFGEILVAHPESDLVTETEFRPFWMEFGSKCIEVGKGITVGSNMFLRWCSPTFTVNYYSIGTYLVNGTWKIRTLY